MLWPLVKIVALPFVVTVAKVEHRGRDRLARLTWIECQHAACGGVVG
jgi:hypothetical protein